MVEHPLGLAARLSVFGVDAADYTIAELKRDGKH